MKTLMTNQQFHEIEENIINMLNIKAQDIVSPFSLSSPRAVGDAVQEFLSQNLTACIPPGIVRNYETGFQRRSMEDMAFYDNNDCYYAIDSKTHNKNTLFNMPNLISVKRLANFYQNDKNFFNILIVEYEINKNKIHYSKCHFNPIEQYSWDCLTLGALGWGQIQIANSNHLLFDSSFSRKKWMIKLCDMMEFFYHEEIGKIGERLAWFNSVKSFWENHP